MAKCGTTNINGGGSASSDDCTATKDKVLKGYTALTKDSNDEVNEGTIPTLSGNAFGGADETAFDTSPIVGAANNNAVGAFDYPLHGYFDNDAVRVHIPNLLPNNIKAGVKVGGKKASLTGTFTSDANAQSSHILSGRSAYVNGVKVNGTMPIQNAETDGDRVWATTASNWAGTFNVGVRNGYYLNGVNWVRYDVPTYRPENIKKGVNIGGVIGTWEGWVPQPTDLYYRGNNIANLSLNYSGVGKATFESGGIRVEKASSYLYTSTPFNFERYNYINIEIYFETKYSTVYSYRNYGVSAKIVPSKHTSQNRRTYITGGDNRSYTISIPLNGLSFTDTYRLDIGHAGEYYSSSDDDSGWYWSYEDRWIGWIYRIWVS
jgi:hypothetical protein